MSSPLQTALIATGELVITGGNTPFLLDDPDSVWFVEAGQVEVFSVRVEAGKTTGTRFHFFSVPAGQMLFGTNSSGLALGRGLLAVGMVNTRLRKLPLARLRALASQPELREEMAQMMDGWITGLSLGVSRDINPRTELMLEPGGKTAIPPSARFRSKRGVLWITHLAGDLLFIGMEDVALAGEPAWFPISQDTWLQALGPATVAAVATRDALGEAALWNGLEVLHQTLFRCEAVNKRLAEVDEYNRLKSRAEAGGRASANALEQLASVLREETVAPVTKVTDPLFLACQEVAGQLAITLVPPPELLRGQPSRDPLGAIVRASRVRTRLVTFKRDWWQEASGPFLAYLAQPRQPVALLPAGAGQYELVNPADGSRRPVDEALAARLEPAGHAFQRSFTDNACSFATLVQFGARGLQKDFLFLCLMGICGGILATLPAMAIGQIFDNIVPEAERLKLLQLAAGLVILAITAAIFEFTRGIASLRIEGRLDQELQAALIDRLLKLPAPFFRDFSSGDLAERAMSLNQIRLVISSTLMNAVLGNAFASFNLLLLFYYDAKLAAAAVAALGVALGFTLVIGLFQLADERHVAAVQGKLAGMVLQFLTGITKLRVAGAESLAFSTWAGQFARQKDLAFRARRLTNRLQVFNAAFPVLSAGLLFHLVTRWSGANPMSTGDFLAFNAAFSGFGAPMMVMTTAALTALNVVPLFDRLRPLLQARPEVTDAKLDPGTLHGGIELAHVSFRYHPDSPLVLQDISLQARPGEFIAIVGPSGSGKSTLMRLLLGFDTPENGVIHFDGQNLAELDIAAVRRQIGVVMQSSKLMAGSILTNIKGATLLTEEDAWRAARLAGLAEDIEAMPMGMHTVIPAGGGVLSGGQQQRLMIARSIVFQPRILLFDEATSALDNRTQAIVSESLEKLQATRVVIAHRLSTIVNADRIFVVEAGRIVQHGTYQELLHQPGLFSELARRQLLDQSEAEGKTFLY